MKDFEETSFSDTCEKKERKKQGHAGRASDYHQEGYNADHGFPNSGLLQLEARTFIV